MDPQRRTCCCRLELACWTVTWMQHSVTGTDSFNGKRPDPRVFDALPTPGYRYPVRFARLGGFTPIYWGVFKNDCCFSCSVQCVTSQVQE